MTHTDEVARITSLDWNDQQMLQHRLRRIPCGRCNAVIEHDRQAPWSVVNNLVNGHWEVCPGRPYGFQRPARMSQAPTFPPGMAIRLSTLPVLSQPDSPKPISEPAGPTKPTWVVSGWERKRKTEKQRKLELEGDEYAMNVTATSVICLGCRRQISLDKRSRYYPGLWLKHKSKCLDIEKLERTKAGTQHPLDNMFQALREVAGDRKVLDGSCNSYGDEDYQTETSQASSSDVPEAFTPPYTHCWSDASSDDEDDMGLLHVPFPTLNRAYYWEYGSDEWTYRYATNEEISTNLFRDSGGR